MQELRVIGVENGALLAASEDGARFRIEIDEVLQSRVRQVQPEAKQGPRLSPREVQAQIRAGLSAEEIARLTGASVEYIRRFEGPVIAERDHMVASALAVQVHLADDIDPAADDPASFGTVIRDRLARLGANGERWASWKDEERGWIVKLEFTADDIDHDARWAFEPKRQSLQPINPEATTLSHQREPEGGMIPRLRAVGQDHDSSRFDSGAFDLSDDDAEGDDRHDAAVPPEPLPYGRPAPLAPAVSSPAVARAAIKRADEPPQAVSETADLLEALRRRRGEREALATEPAPVLVADPVTTVESGAAAPSEASPSAAAERPAAAERTAAERPAPAAAGRPAVPDDQPGAAARALWGGRGQGNTSSGRSRRGRASMPSWDEIVFGARSDDDLA